MSHSSPKPESVSELIRYFFPYLRSLRWVVVFAGFLVVFGPLLNVALLWLMKAFIDEVFVAKQFSRLQSFVAGYLLLVAMVLLLSYTGTRVEAFLSEAISYQVRTDFYRHMISVSPGTLRRFSVGDLLSRLSGDAERVEFLIYSGPIAVASNIIGAFYYGIFLLFLSWKLTGCALIVAPVFVLVSRRLASRVRRASTITRRKTDSWLSLAEERLSAVPAVQAFNASVSEAHRFEARCRAARRAALQEVSVQAWFTLLVEIAGAVGGFLVLAVGAYEMYHDRLTVGSLVAFLGLVGSLYSPIRSLAKASGRFQRAAAGAQRLRDLGKIASLVVERPDAKELRNVRGDLEFRELRFAYPGGPEVLHGVSFRVSEGETVALVGANGSGKSTLIQLAVRLYDPTAGAVLLDGVDLRTVTLKSLRDEVGVVFQEPFLFRTSLSQNIRYGRDGQSSEAFIAAARAAYLDGFVGAMPAGYAAPVGPRGTWLSGGQRQRVALARAFLRDARVLLLDEATASVDSESEELIQLALERFAGRRTILVVSHRLSSVQRADRVVVLENGHIVEIGRPADLQAHNGRYRTLFEPQIRAEPVLTR